ncbi:MAG TPA: hypothetical protein VFQ61_00235, partial [Polyangiaceae bacterium]|nr:hypothetical protein [Polyangiaceae bacterium]
MKIGDCIAGRFRIEARAASGGMGTLFHAIDQSTLEAVALKTWLPTQPPAPQATDADSSDRLDSLFEREARALCRVEHPAVVRYVAHGISAEREPYLVMGWVPGEDLAHRL